MFYLSGYLFYQILLKIICPHWPKYLTNASAIVSNQLWQWGPWRPQRCIMSVHFKSVSFTRTFPKICVPKRAWALNKRIQLDCPLLFIQKLGLKWSQNGILGGETWHLLGQTAASSVRPMPESDQSENTIDYVWRKSWLLSNPNSSNDCRTHVQSKTNGAKGKWSALGEKIRITWTM